MREASDRFVLHEEDGLFGVYDRVGPQIFFASGREEALREVARANEIVRLHPTTISMRHLREMDAAWRRANGLPPLPEPEGRTVVITPEPMATSGSGALTPTAGSPPAGAVAAILDTAARIAERDSIRSRIEEARESLQRTRALGRELTRAWVASEADVARMGSALREIYGPGARDAEAELRALLRSIDRTQPAGAYAAAARRYLTRSTGGAVPGAGVEDVAASAPAVAAWDHASAAAEAATGAQVKSGASDRARYNQLLSALRRMRAAGERTLATARADYAATATGPTPRTLRELWRSLSAPDRDAVLQVLPEVSDLIRPAHVRHRPRRSHGPGGMSL